MTNRRSCCCSCFSCFSGRNAPSPPSAPLDPANAPSPTEIVATGHQYPPSTSGKSIEPSFSASSSAVVVKQDDEVAGSAPHPSAGASCTPSAGTSSIPSAPPPSAGASSISGKSIEPSFSASCSAVVVKQDDHEFPAPPPSGGSSSISSAPPPSAGASSVPSGGASCTPSAGASSIPLAPPPSAGASSIPGKSIEPSFSASSSAVVVKQDDHEFPAPPPSGGSSSIPSAPPPSAGASSSSTVPQTEGDNVEVIDALIERISQRLELIKERKKPPQTKGAQQDWPKTFFKLKEMISEGINVVKDIIPSDTINTAVKGVLQGMGTAHLVTAGLLVVANILERLEEVKANKDECLRLLKEMFFLAKVVKQFKESPRLNEERMHDIIKETTELIVEGSTMCCYQIDSSKYSKFFRAPVNKEDLDNFRQEIDRIYRQINTQMGICILDATALKKAPLSRIYPDDAVGIEESVKEVIDLLEWGSDKNAIAVMLHGFGGIGKTTLADAVVSVLDIQGCKYSALALFEDINSTPKIMELQTKILKDLMEPGQEVDIRMQQDGRRQIGQMLEKVPAFIYIDNVLDQEELGKLLPKDMKRAKKVRLLLTARDQDVRTAVKVKTYVYPMKGLPDSEAMKLLGREIYDDEREDKEELKKIVQSYGGIPKLLEVVGGFIRGQENKQEAYKILMEEKEKWDSEVGKIESYLFAYNHLPEISKDPFLDICSYFKGWDWDTVEHIVGELELKMLESRALVTKGTNGVVAVHDVILSIGLEKTKGMRFTFTSGKQLQELLNEKETPQIKGIWVSENNKDLLDISASKLDSMCSSLRVLALGNLIKVQGTCNETFEKLVFLQAAVPHLPFDVSQSKGLKYLKYEPKDLNFHEIPSSVTCMEFDGRFHSNAFEISSGDFQHLGKLRILRLTHFVALKKLPEELADLLNGLRELTLSYCSSVKELPGSISKLQYLRVIRMEYCSSLTQLPEDFGSLICLQKLILQGCENLKMLPSNFRSLISLQNLNLQGCKNLKVLPDHFEKLTALKLLDLSYCERLVDLPHGLGNLTSLAELDLKGCSQLTSIPENIGQLKSLASSVNMSGCSSLKELPNGFCNLSFITQLSLVNCSNLEKLPDRFGKLVNLWMLDLRGCKKLEDLCNDFHCLDSLAVLWLGSCHSLKALPERFQCLASLRKLDLSSCLLLEGKEMDKVVKIKTLLFVDIQQSEMLVKRWGEIQREDNALRSFTVFTGQELSEDRKATVEKELLSEFDSLLSNGEGQPFPLSDHLSADSLFLLIFHYPEHFDDNDFPWPLFEETIDEIQTKFEIIYMGYYFNKLPLKVKGKIVGHTKELFRAADVFMKLSSISDSADKKRVVGDPNPNPNICFEMRTKMAGDEKGAKDYRPCWKWLTSPEVEEFLLSNCRSYHRLKQLEARSGDQSNIELLRELFPTGKGETAHIFRKINYASQKASIETCGVEELKGKRILLDIRPIDMCYDIRMESLIQLYNTMKEAFNLEVISIPLVQPNTNIKLEMFEQFSGDAPWLVLQNPWMLRRVVKCFLIKGCLPDLDQGHYLWGKEIRIMYKSIITIIEADGKVFTADKPVLPLLDRWGPKAYPFTGERIKELEEEWSQMETTSTLELLLNNQESLWHKVKEILLQQKMICLFGGDGSQEGISMNQFTFFLRNVLIEFVDNIHIIYIAGFDFKEAKRSKLTDATYVCYGPPSKPHMPKAKMEEMPLLNLLEHEAIRFWTHFYSLREIVSKRDDNSKLKRLFDSIGYHVPWMILIDKDGEIITENGQDMVSLYTKGMEEKAKRLMQILIKGSKEDMQKALFELEQR